MTDNELLREASDPATPGERLAELFQTTPVWDANASSDLYSPVTAFCHALLANPSLPPDLVMQAVYALPRPRTFAVWHNPMLPLLLLTEPDTHPREMARMALMFAQAFADRQEWCTSTDDLEAMVTHWHALGPGPDATTVRSYVWRLAYRLAFLFSLSGPASPAPVAP